MAEALENILDRLNTENPEDIVGCVTRIVQAALMRVNEGKTNYGIPS